MNGMAGLFTVIIFAGRTAKKTIPKRNIFHIFFGL